MPTYVHQCLHCEKREETFCKMSELDNLKPYCCGDRMTRIIQPVYGYVQSDTHYRCPVTKEGVTSRKQRKEIFAKHRLQDASDVNVPKEIAKRQAAHAESVKLAAKMPGFNQIDVPSLLPEI